MVQVALGHADEAITLYERLLNDVDVTKDPNSLALILSNLGTVHEQLGDLVLATELHEQALTIANTSSDREIKFITFQHLSKMYYRIGKLREAQALGLEALEIVRQLGNKDAESILLLGLGEIHLGFSVGNMIDEGADDASLTLNQVQDVVAYFEQALAIQRKLSSPQNLGNALLSLGRVWYLCSEMERASTYFTEAVHIFRQSQNWSAVANALNNLCGIYLFEGAFSEIVQSTQESLALYQQIGNSRGMVMSLQWMAVAYKEMNMPQQAVECYQQGIATLHRVQAKDKEAWEAGLLCKLAALYVELKQISQAVGHYQAAIQIYQEHEGSLEQIDLFNEVGNIYSTNGHYHDALRSYFDGLSVAQEIGLIEGQEILLGNIATTYNEIGQSSQTLTYLEQALSISEQTGNLESERTIRRNMVAYYYKAQREPEAVTQLRQVVELGRQIQNPDLEEDIALLAEMETDLDK